MTTLAHRGRDRPSARRLPGAVRYGAHPPDDVYQTETSSLLTRSGTTEADRRATPAARRQPRVLGQLELERRAKNVNTSSLACTAVVAPVSAKPLPVANPPGPEIEVTTELGHRLLAGHDPLNRLRLSSVLKTRLPSAFRRWSSMGPPAASYVPRVNSRNGVHSPGLTPPRRR